MFVFHSFWVAWFISKSGSINFLLYLIFRKHIIPDFESSILNLEYSCRYFFLGSCLLMLMVITYAQYLNKYLFAFLLIPFLHFFIFCWGAGIWVVGLGIRGWRGFSTEVAGSMQLFCERRMVRYWVRPKRRCLGHWWHDAIFSQQIGLACS